MGDPIPGRADTKALENGSYNLSGLNQALREGNRLRISKIGDEIRAVLKRDTITGLETGGPSTDRILEHLSRNYLATPNRLHIHFEDREDFKMSPLDGWVYRQGNRVEAYMSEGSVVVDLVEQTATHVPQEVYDMVNRTGEPVIWKDEDRGYTYEISRGLLKVVGRDPNRKKRRVCLRAGKKGRR
jgi:hypothetical protein